MDLMVIDRRDRAIADDELDLAVDQQVERLPQVVLAEDLPLAIGIPRTRSRCIPRCSTSR
ncbi:hypothetical protein [Kribbella sp. DT2]|uniref:hypothetical protein n=1 Tax=Kribbella sp. DT2 TaxID=3393427 RepID=UPI003CEB118A